jgi:hypothetical protein
MGFGVDKLFLDMMRVNPGQNFVKLVIQFFNKIVSKLNNDTIISSVRVMSVNS